MNVKTIQQKAEQGDLVGAHESLDALLELGPKNLEALKLRASLHMIAGRFHQEALVWEKIAQIARNDDDLIDYLVRRQLEDREHFYFTDALQNGGRRFMAFSKKHLKSAALGLCGCFTFFILVRLGERFPSINVPSLIIGTFLGCVILPFLSIIFGYMRSLKSVTMSPEGLEIATRLKSHKLLSSQIKQIYVVHEDLKSKWDLSIVVVPETETQIEGQRVKSTSAFKIDLNQETTSVQARSHFVRDLARYFGELRFVARDEIEQDLRTFKVINF